MNDIVNASQADLALMKSQLEEFENNRITKDTTVADLQKRFPQFAREIEEDLQNHQWAKSAPLQ